MNRRKFFKVIGVGTGAVLVPSVALEVIAKSVPKEIKPISPDIIATHFLRNWANESPMGEIIRVRKPIEFINKPLIGDKFSIEGVYEDEKKEKIKIFINEY